MAYKAIQFQEEPEPELMQWKPPSLGGGLCLKDLEQNLLDDQTPKALNVWYLNSILGKRYGQEFMLTENIAGTPILAIYEKRYNGNIIFHCGTSLYIYNNNMPSDWDSGIWSTATWGGSINIFTGLTAVKGSFFAMGSNLYYINGNQYVKFDGTTCSLVSPYIPVTFTATPPTGGGTALEEDNRLGAGQTNRFSGNGTATYQLSKTNLDATLVTAIVGGVAKVETTNFTVNRTTGVVTFTIAPPSGTNNVDITFYKTETAIYNALIACKYAITYGDSKETVFIGGNLLGEVFWSDKAIANYFPLGNKGEFGDTNEDCTGFGIQYDTLIIFKPKTLYSGNTVTGTTLAEFSFSIVNDSIGCDMPYTIQLISNRLTWCNTYGGVHTLTSTLIKDERNVKPIGENIHGTQFRNGLLDESNANLLVATSHDWAKNNQYWICVGENVYMWDYGLRPYTDSGDLSADQRKLSWWKFDNVNANCFFSEGDDLYYGDRTIGNISHFITQFNDFGVAINATFRIPLRNFGINDWYKTISRMTITSRADSNTKMNIEYINERDSRVDPQPILLSSFTWATFSWVTFIWSVINFGKSFTRYPNSKHVLYFSVEFSNNDVGRDLSIIELIILWMRSKKIR